MAAKPKPGRYYHLFVKHSGKVLGTDGTRRGAVVQQQNFDSRLPVTQQFEFISVNQNEYFIKPRFDMYLDVVDSLLVNGALLNVWTWNRNTANQRFRLIPGPEGYYYIRCVVSNKVLDVEGLSMDDKARVIQHDQHRPEQGPHQLFKLVLSSARNVPASSRSFQKVNEDVRNALVGLVSGAPKVGGALKMLMGALWPATDKDQLFWNQMKDYVDQRISLMIRESELNTMEVHLKGALENVQMIEQDTSTLPKGNAVEMVMRTIVSNHASFLDHDRAEYDDPSQSHTSTDKSPLQIMPYLVGMGTILLSLMRQRVVNYDELYVADAKDRTRNIDSHLRALRGMMYKYLRAVIRSREQAITWRLSFISDVTTTGRPRDRHELVYSEVSDAYDGWKLRWEFMVAAAENEPGVDGMNHKNYAEYAREQRIEQVRVQFGAEMDEFLNPARLWKFQDRQTPYTVNSSTNYLAVGAFGGPSGGTAIEPPANHGTLKRVVVYSHPNREVAGLELEYQGSAAQFYGARTGQQQTLDLEGDEYIVSVEGTERGSIETLTFYSNKGRQASGGVNYGRRWPGAAYWNADVPDSLQARLHKVTGVAHGGGITRLTLHWAYTYTGEPLPAMQDLPVPPPAEVQAVRDLTQHLQQLA